MSDTRFFQTPMGQKFYNGHVPRLLDLLSQLVKKEPKKVLVVTSVSGPTTKEVCTAIEEMEIEKGDLQSIQIGNIQNPIGGVSAFAIVSHFVPKTTANDKP